MTQARDIESQASEWLVRLDSDRSEPTRVQFEKWLEADPRHRAAFVRLESSWNRADRLKNIRPLDGTVNDNVLDTFPQPKSVPEAPAAPAPPKRTLWFAIAAGIAILAVGPVMWFVGSNFGWETYTTQLGGFQRISLTDGSTALLNTNSQIRVRMLKDHREIVLDRGEALFTVAHDVTRPFDVKAGETIVRAIGTAFSVRLRDQKQVDVIVTEGRVAIDPPDVAKDVPLSQTAPVQRLSELDAGQSVTVHATRRLQVEKIDHEDMSRKLAWTQGRLWFDRVTLAEAVAEFNRYNHRQLVIDDASIAGLRIGGAFDATDLDSFVAALGTFGIKAATTRANANDRDSEVIHLTGGGKH